MDADLSHQQLAVPHVVRHYYMQQALARGFPRLARAPRPRDRSEVLQIIGYGASLLETWRSIDRDQPIMTLSGAHDFVISRNLLPAYHADCDPRAHKAEFVRFPGFAMQYLMASCCHPRSWEYLNQRNVTLWHKINGPETRAWLEQHHEDSPSLVAIEGCSIGIAALGLARDALGFQRVRLFGFDSCYSEDGELRAGFSEGAIQPIESMVVGGITYVTTENMKRQALEFMTAAAGLEYEIVGDGLLKAIVNRERDKHAEEATA